jgi:hypothetical protein
MPRVIRMMVRPLYDFDSLHHGDAIDVESKAGAQEMLRRWRNKTGRRAQLVSIRGLPNRLYFLDQGPDIDGRGAHLRRDVA